MLIFLPRKACRLVTGAALACTILSTQWLGRRVGSMRAYCSLAGKHFGMGYSTRGELEPQWLLEASLPHGCSCFLWHSGRAPRIMSTADRKGTLLDPKAAVNIMVQPS